MKNKTKNKNRVMIFAGLAFLFFLIVFVSFYLINNSLSLNSKADFIIKNECNKPFQCGGKCKPDEQCRPNKGLLRCVKEESCGGNQSGQAGSKKCSASKWVCTCDSLNTDTLKNTCNCPRDKIITTYKNAYPSITNCCNAIGGCTADGSGWAKKINFFDPTHLRGYIWDCNCD